MTDGRLGLSLAIMVEAGDELGDAAIVAKLDLYWVVLDGVCALFGEEMDEDDED